MDYIAVYQGGKTVRLVNCHGYDSATVRARRIESYDVHLIDVYAAEEIELRLPAARNDIHARCEFI